jgi:Tfp pilus assembly protein PilV
MHTLFATLWSVGRSMRGGAAELTSTLQRRLSLPADLRAESGISLIEVLISALLVAIITVGTFTAFGGASRASGAEKARAQAVQLAGEDEERLRSVTAVELASLTTKAAGEPKAITVGGTVFEITSSAHYVSAEKETYSCETTGAKPDYVQTSSSVTWKSFGTHAPVVQSSIVTNSASGLLVRVINQRHEPLEGATVSVVGTTTTTQTTSAGGCVTFLGLIGGTNNEVTVSASKGFDVDTAGKNPPASKTVTLSPTHIASAEFMIAEPGSIAAKFGTEKAAGTLTEVEGETFVAAQSEMPSPKRFVGGVVPLERKLTQEQKGLFPFTKIEKPLFPPEPYTVYAGDCEANDPHTVTGGVVVEDPKAGVEPNKPATPNQKLELPTVNVKVNESAKPTKTLLKAASVESAMFINTECKGQTAQNFGTEVPYKHPVKFLAAAGEIEEKYRRQPFAKKMELCVVAKISGKWWKYTTPAFENKTKLGTTLAEIFLAEAGTGHVGPSGTKLECP